MIVEWWHSLVSKWSWDDPMLLLGLASFVATAIIPIVLWRVGAKQAKRDSELQAKILARQTLVSQLQRRDALLGIVTQSSDARYLEVIWKEILEYKEEDRDFLLAHLRANPALALPGTSTGAKVQDNLTDAAVSNYVDGFERRYAESDGYMPYPGLLKFIEEAIGRGVKIDTLRIIALVTGPTAEKQRPGHYFYRDLVNLIPSATGGLLHAVERINPQAPGGLKLNVLTGALLAVKDLEMGRLGATSNEDKDKVEKLRGGIAQALAYLLHRGVLSSFDQWDIKGSTDSVTSAVAWLIRAVGWVADGDSHLEMRMIQNLALAIESLPESEGNWGIDDVDVRQGFEWISEKCPDLWEIYGERLEAAVAEVGQRKEQLSS
jgi:hypothetical protein